MCSKFNARLQKINQICGFCSMIRFWNSFFFAHNMHGEKKEEKNWQDFLTMDVKLSIQLAISQLVEKLVKLKNSSNSDVWYMEWHVR